jgi:hypothetical protein
MSQERSQSPTSATLREPSPGPEHEVEHDDPPKEKINNREQSVAGESVSAMSSGSRNRQRNRGFRRRRRREKMPNLKEQTEDPMKNVNFSINKTATPNTQSGEQQEEPRRPHGQKEALKLRLDLNLEVDIQLKATIRGDVTLSLL